jgi:mRNA interferase RelE/StbE
MYKLEIKKSAQKKLLQLPSKQREQIFTQLDDLAENPENQQLDVKKLTSRPGFRLRVGNWRVIFERNDSLRVLLIEKIGSRGDVYK